MADLNPDLFSGESAYPTHHHHKTPPFNNHTLLPQASTVRRREKPGRKRQKLDKAEPKMFSRNPAAMAASPSDKVSRIVCECQWGPDRTRCSASPLPQEGKENEEEEEEGRRLAAGGCRVSCLLEKGEDEEMGGGGIFPDDDSNQILPVEQFFGNLDAMQVSLVVEGVEYKWCVTDPFVYGFPSLLFTLLLSMDTTPVVLPEENWPTMQ